MARKGANSDDGSPKRTINRESLKQAKKLIVYLKPYKWHFGFGLVMLALSSLSSLALFTFVGDLFDIDNANFAQEVKKVAMLLGAILIIQTISGFLRIYLFTYTAENVISKLKQDVFSKLITLPMSYFSEKRVGELTSRLTADISSIKDSFTTTLATFVREFIIITGAIIFLSVSNFKMVLFILAVLPIVVIFALIFGRRVRKFSKEAQQANAEATTILEEALQAIATVKAFTGEMFEKKRFGFKIEEVAAKGLKNGIFMGAFVSFLIVFLFGSIIAVIWYGASLVAAGEITNGQLFEFFIISVMMAASMGGIADSFNNIQKALGATESVLKILEEREEDFSVISEVENGDIVFENVSFSYPDKKDFPILQNISFEVKTGQMVALVGPSGAGKSTLISLLLRMYDATSGAIKIKEKNIAELSLKGYRDMVALVPQEVILFGGSIRENILYGNPNASEEEIIEAAKKANAHNFIMELPDKYETIVGERGTKLSGGQRQRVAIARAFIKNPSILLLDEATSALDSESEKSVQEALLELMKGRTTFVVAHRLSTIRNADVIMVMEKGEIKEMGTHQYLLEIENGIYKNLAGLQFRA